MYTAFVLPPPMHIHYNKGYINQIKDMYQDLSTTFKIHNIVTPLSL